MALPPRLGDELQAARLNAAEKVARLEEAEISLHEEAARLAASGVQATATVLDGPIPSTLADYLQASDADLIVMGSHDPGNVERVLVGSVAEKLIRHVNKPVLLLRNPPFPMRRILVALDGSDFSDQVIPHATALAESVGAEVVLITVVLPILAAASAGLGEPVVGVPTAAMLPNPDLSVEMQREWLASKAEELRSHGVAATSDAVAHGSVGRAITEYADEHSVDVIAMSTHGRGAVKRLITGSVATHVLHSAHKSMLVFRPRQA